MKAIIFNSGLGKRMGKFTETHHKSMTKLLDNITILERQIRILKDNNIKEFIITTGPFSEQIKEVCNKFPDLKFTFVHNDLYNKTNYIYSMYLASSYLDDDFLLLHGDLVFNKELVTKMLNNQEKDICLINEEKALPQKDFKGKVQNNLLKKVSINIFQDDCYAFQPLYKLSKETLQKWVSKVKEFVNENKTDVYAEEALNEILPDLKIYAMSYKDDYIDEIDDEIDHLRVQEEIKEYEAKNIS